MTNDTSNSHLIQQIRKFSRVLVRELDAVKGSYLESGLTLSQCHVLFELDAHGAMHLMELSDVLLMDKSNTSRSVKKLVGLGLIKSKKVATDHRQKLFSLTAQGRKILQSVTTRADAQVHSALQNLSPDQGRSVVDGLSLYSKALTKSRLQDGLQIRAIGKQDDAAVAELIRDVMIEFGAVGEGYSIVDPEVDNMFGSYQADRHFYCVVEAGANILGVGGIAPLRGGGKQTCELRKMFYRPEIRGIGMGRRLLLVLLDKARSFGFEQCYLETLERMPQAIHLYTQAGFQRLEKPMGKTGHCRCDHWYLLEL